MLLGRADTIDGIRMASIVTVTLNPSLDKATTVPKVMPEHKLRCSAPTYDPGGGGINVARAIHRLGGQASAIWTRGGHLGHLVSGMLDREHIDHQPVDIEGLTREHLIVLEESSSQQYRFGMPGPQLKAEEVDAVLDSVAGVPAPDYLVFSGSLPGGVDNGIYARISRQAPAGCRVVVDAKGDVLQASLIGTPLYLIKPNVRELGQLSGREIGSDDEILQVSHELIDRYHVQVVITSLGSGGAMLVTSQVSEQLRSPTVPIRSKVGAGDSMVGGIVLGLSRGWPVRDAVRFGIAAGAAAVMTDGTQLCRRQDVERLYQTMNETVDREKLSSAEKRP